MSEPEDQPDGPNLNLFYGLLALAATTGFTLMIVLPFDHRR
jgi:hypothetical protein